MEHTENLSLFQLSDCISVKDPLCILNYPDRVETVFREQHSVATKRTRTFQGDLAKAKEAAQRLRDIEWKVSVYRGVQYGNPRIQIEYRAVLANGNLARKRTKILVTEQEAVEFLNRVDQTLRSGDNADKKQAGGSR